MARTKDEQAAIRECEAYADRHDLGSEHGWQMACDKRATEIGFEFDESEGCSCPNKGEHGHHWACGFLLAWDAPWVTGYYGDGRENLVRGCQ